MKKILFVLLMVALAQPAAMKAQTPTLVLHHADGKTSEVELYTMPRIQMTADKMIVTVQGSRQEFPKADVFFDRLPLSISVHTGPGAVGIGLHQKISEEEMAL